MQYVLLTLCLLFAEAHAFGLDLPMKVDDLNGHATEIQVGKRGAVLIFMSARCPCSDSHVKLVKTLAPKFPDFNFYAIHANGDEPLAEAKKYFAAKAIPFPVLQDEGQKLANLLKANKTPHAFIISTDGKVIYRGGVTDSHEAANAHQQYLNDALTALMEGKAVPLAETRTLGCAISRAAL